MAVYRRSDKNGGVQWWIDFYFEGERIRRPAGTSKKRAEQALNGIKVAIAAGTFDPYAQPQPEPPAVPLFRQKVLSYTADREARGRSARSYQALRLDGFWCKHLGSRPLDEITAEEIEGVLQRERRRQKWSPATYNNRLNQLSGFLKWCSRSPRKWIPDNPCQRIERLEVGQNARTRWLRRAELLAIVDHAEDQARPAILFAALSGLRYGELCALTKASVVKDGDAWSLAIEDTKNGEALMFPLEGEARAIIAAQEAAAKFPGSPLFPSPRGKSPDNWLRLAFQAAVEAAGLPYGKRGRDGIVFHTLRHTFATTGLMAGLSERQLAGLGNWKTPSMVRRYAKLVDDSLRSGARDIAAALAPVADGHGVVTEPPSADSESGVSPLP